MIIMSRENGGFNPSNPPSSYFNLESCTDSFVEADNLMDVGTLRPNNNNSLNLGERKDSLAPFYIYENLQAMDPTFEFHHISSTELPGKRSCIISVEDNILHTSIRAVY